MLLLWDNREARCQGVGGASRQIMLRRTDVTAQGKRDGAGRGVPAGRSNGNPEARTSEKANRGGEGWTVLIVEDDPYLFLALTQYLSLTGRYQVHAAKSVAEGRTLLGRLEIDAALLDLALPDGSGAQLLSDIRERWGDEVAVVLMSGFASVPSAVEFVKQGADDCLCKPFELAEIERRLRALLERKGPLSGAAGPLAPAPSVHLTATHVQVLAALREGKPDAEIAQEMGLSTRTVQDHVSHLLATLGVANRTAAVALSYRCDLLLPALAERETETGAAEIPAKSE